MKFYLYLDQQIDNSSQAETTSDDNINTVCKSLEAVATWAASLKSEGNMLEVSKCYTIFSDIEFMDTCAGSYRYCIVCALASLTKESLL